MKAVPSRITLTDRPASLPYIVKPHCQETRKLALWPSDGSYAAASRYPVLCAGLYAEDRIAVGDDLWFDETTPIRRCPARARPLAQTRPAAGSVGPASPWRHAFCVFSGSRRATARTDRGGNEREARSQYQMHALFRLARYALTGAVLIAMGGVAFAGLGQPTPWQLGLQEAASPVMVDVTRFHDFLLWITSAITLFVLILLVIVMVRFNARAHPTPSRTTHNTVIELIWTIVPVVILVAIAVPSFRLLFLELDAPKPDLTIKATGKQWYWSYNYPDNGDFEFDSLIVEDKDLKSGQPRLLTVDHELVVPVNKVVHVLVTGADVIHSFAVPSFGIKIDAVPGRINDTWFKATIQGTFHGQCSELCGKDHSFMPITVRVTDDKGFAAWAAQAKQKYADGVSPPPTTVAAAQQ